MFIYCLSWGFTTTSNRATFCCSQRYSCNHALPTKNCKMLLSNFVKATEEFKWLLLKENNLVINQWRNKNRLDLASLSSTIMFIYCLSWCFTTTCNRATLCCNQWYSCNHTSPTKNCKTLFSSFVKATEEFKCMLLKENNLVITQWRNKNRLDLAS